MLKKYSIVLGTLLSITLLIISTVYYPGGSQYDQNSIGYDWKNNYLCNLFSPKAINGMANASRYWAISGMLILCASAAYFFIRFSKKIPDNSSSIIIKYFGSSSMLFAFLAVTPYHDTAVTIANTLSLVSTFYITIFTFKSKLHVAKILSIFCLFSGYTCTYIYYTRNYLEVLPIMQKISLFSTLVWMLWLEYFTKARDFQSFKKINSESAGEVTNTWD